MDKDQKTIKFETAEYVVEKLEKWFELVEPTEKFKSLKDIVGGDTILDSVTNYIMYYGYTKEFSAMFVEQRQIYLAEKNKPVLIRAAKNSINGFGAKAEEAKKGIIEYTKENYKKALAGLLIISGLAVGGLTYYYVDREIDLIDAGQDIYSVFQENFDSHTATLEINLKNKYSKNPVTDFHMFLVQHDFTKAEILYLIEKYDKNSLDTVLDYYGYSSLYDFLCDYYFDPIYSGSEEPVVLGKSPNYKKFKNAVEEGIKDKAKLLKENYGIDLDDSKGMGSR